jgi:hypothetical protein
LREAGLPTSQADAAAAGWGGDRLAVLNGPDDTWAVVLETAWDTADDATAFRDAAETAVAGLPQPGSVVETDDDRIRILVASDEATLLKLDVLIGETGV